MRAMLTTRKGQIETNNRRLYTRGTMGGVTLVFFGPAKWGKLVNISEGGMAFEFYELPPSGQRIGFDLEAMGREASEASAEVRADSIHVDGRVVWRRDFERCAGVQFLELSRPVRRQISQALSIEPSSEGHEKRECNAIEAGQDVKIETDLVQPSLTLDGPASEATDQRPLFHTELAQAGSPVVVWEFGETPQPTVDEPVAAKPRISRAQLTSVALSLSALAMIAGITAEILLQRSHLAAPLERMRERLASNDASRPAGEHPIGENPLAFQVEAVDANNKRRLLRFDDDASALETWASSSPAASRTAYNPLSVKNAALPTERSVAKKRRSLFNFTLGKPTVTRAASNASTEVATPAIDSVASSKGPIVAGDPSGEILANTARQALAAPPVPASGEVQQARLISSVSPVYPAFARFIGVQGDIIIDAVVDPTGKVTSMKPLSGPALLQGAAMDALRHWKYEPARLNGQPVSNHLSVKVKFRLN